ncbi:MAG: tyrosine-type recombinase/integrase [Actinomycetia bacterium]|nr:tyrosine-type recombinase/integrase [Actinomycetes bacterium]
MTANQNTPQSYMLGLLRVDLEGRGLLPGTINEYCRQLRPLLAEVVDVTSLSRTEVIAWIGERDTASKRRFRWLAIKALFRMLVDEELVASNPCNEVTMPKEQVRPQPYVSDETYAALLASCASNFIGRRDKAILTLLNSTGCRRGELVALNVGDVDLTKGTVLIRQSKTGVGRYAFLDDQCIKTLLLWLRERTGVSALPVESQSPLWVARSGKRLEADGVRLMLHRKGAALGETVSAHQFRRRLAVRWLLAGLSQTGLMTAAGWTSPEMPGRYAAQAAAEIAQSEHKRLFP